MCFYCWSSLPNITKLFSLTKEWNESNFIYNSFLRVSSYWALLFHKLAGLLCPWDSPGRNTGVGCHLLLQGTFLTQEDPESPALAGRFFTTEPPGKPHVCRYLSSNWDMTCKHQDLRSKLSNKYICIDPVYPLLYYHEYLRTHTVFTTHSISSAADLKTAYLH